MSKIHYHKLIFELLSVIVKHINKQATLIEIKQILCEELKYSEELNKKLHTRVINSNDKLKSYLLVKLKKENKEYAELLRDCIKPIVLAAAIGDKHKLISKLANLNPKDLQNTLIPAIYELNTDACFVLMQIEIIQRHLKKLHRYKQSLDDIQQEVDIDIWTLAKSNLEATYDVLKESEIKLSKQIK